jgi:hypothetical protein
VKEAGNTRSDEDGSHTLKMALRLRRAH